MSEPNEAERAAQAVVDSVNAMERKQPSGADVSAISALIKRLVVELKKDQDLRRWAVDKAVDSGEGVNTAEAYYNFVCGQTNEVISNLTETLEANAKTVIQPQDC